MAFYQPQDLTNALLPTTFFYWIVGMGVIEYPVGNPRRIFGFIYSSIICMSFAIALFISSDLMELGGKLIKSSIGSFAFRIYIWMTGILTSVVVIISIQHNRKRNDCVKELMDIGGIMQRMGVTSPYRIIFIRQLWQLFGSMFATLMMNTFEFVYLAPFGKILGWLKISSGWYYQNYVVLLSTVGDIAFCALIGVMTTYFKDLNSLLESMKVNPLNEYNTRMGNLIQVDVVIADKQKLERLRCIRMIHSRLVRVAKRWTDLNAVHIFSTVVSAVPTLTLLAHSTYVFFINLKYPSYDKVGFARNSLWIIFWSWKLFNIVGTTATLISEAKRTGEILLTCLHPIAFLRSEVHEFSLQLIQNPLRLSAGGLFELDYSLLQMVITSVSTYLVVLIQTRNA